ncbi:hypothetical protein CBS115989_581 [Aspergillus niger]|uniref:Survival Motor Neuron Gemin2-binding domain-containing protein n=1 Tax=Aspergillus niger ATCC 13496 TaxID=1353008 RepID=A0A370BZD4_ASPNG|nr:hypothetical protein ANI_1_1558184 [Aspergillus niger CBS 513.88]KAI2824624.1 hypothetical protein CBS115989_581 [Aspergillus niger]RDH21097.1 hypothetical protein M747DRAFT_341016 [Aspergillus niger ATCC 13496]KAI2860650.1 hypothetical protein CBS11232_1500 [Aspergillus niger]KAI2867765.1 hypothetical protein CBS12448_211 [Aspergillus niger]KAI2881073.1 hypothetical protein CBS115988_935 [Aspergillus niger]|eukprot:XP_001401433.2 hypothetical protein ANI_1_1558184 [Aspergillus niger CBS 513.88]
MGKSAKANKPLTQEEIWDDSALVQSWDEAVEEYKLYHSIHAKGENVEDVLREAEAAEKAEVEQDEQPLDESADRMDADVDADTTANATTPAEPQQVSQAKMSQAAEGPEQPFVQGAQVTEQTAGPSPVGAPPMPHATLSQVQDEGLKNLMMAWYYAGYYTGLYEGQQRANQNRSS